ncbi:1-acyl-sn-glycerol-3-phosphate acyltransferase [Atopomonas hussainii]|uniref:1-acyl-sn-glycerol-3-phosphate acyltransferase n=1 Tax=Atopomonas hussainii TaxID=1429083 RepID=A0A1H7I2T9_9GAMM|nr:acyltransferase [Atopomonas hussainii]SEK56856.1 1-acyl-sn-glycerol-3-phosphate acyltransferase [Atopomonas hussainii]
MRIALAFAYLKASAIIALLLLDTLILIGPMLALALLKLLIPIPAWRALCSKAVMTIAETWAEGCKLIFAWLTPTQWDIRGGAGLSKQRSYLVVSNHQSWVDIPALVVAFNNKTPYFKFFLKQELIWVPLLGLAFWALDYPFMKRYSKAFLAKHPHLQGKDLEITKAACAKFRNMPVNVVNYLEGTRCTPAKQAAQQSPYRNLLKPKAGGIAFTLAALQGQLDTLLDVTLIYPGSTPPTFSDLLLGRVAKVIVDIQQSPLDERLSAGDYENDALFRAEFQRWVTTLWQAKDARIDLLRAEAMHEQDK